MLKFLVISQQTKRSFVSIAQLKVCLESNQKLETVDFNLVEKLAVEESKPNLSPTLRSYYKEDFLKLFRGSSGEILLVK